MDLSNTERLSDGWGWRESDGSRIELVHAGGVALVGERLDQKDAWRFVYRVEHSESVFIESLGEVTDRSDPRRVLADVARCIDEDDRPPIHLGEMLEIKDGTVRNREWRMQ